MDDSNSVYCPPVRQEATATDYWFTPRSDSLCQTALHILGHINGRKGAKHSRPRRAGLLAPRYEPRRHADAGHGRLSKRTPRSSHMFLCSHDVSEFMLHA